MSTKGIAGDHRLNRTSGKVSLKLRSSDFHVDADLPSVVGDLVWYALVVPPQKEFIAQKTLRLYGLRTFVPVRTEYRHRSKYARRRREPKVEAIYPRATRYVFVGFEPGRPLWFDLFSLPIVVGVVGIGGRPVPIRTTDMADLIRRTFAGRNAPRMHQWMRTHAEFSEGDAVRVASGPFEGVESKVVEIRGAQAKVRLDVFGGEQDVALPLDLLERA